MRLWRLSAAAYANRLDGGYGRDHAGRWNRLGELVTYAATVPSLCVLEKLAHIEDLTLLPNDLRLIELRTPDDLPVTALEEPALPHGWWWDTGLTQALGSAWHRERSTPLLRVPSVVARSRETADRNMVVNHLHPRAAEIGIAGVEPFEIDLRLLARPEPSP
jgi:RES domain-containing protein